MVRTPSCDKTGLKKGTWTPEEDRKLIAYVTRYGHWNWRQLPKYAGLARCGKSCRLRWMNYLKPEIKRGNYSKEEEDTIIRLRESLGNRWSAIAAQLPGRTDNGIKNHWHTSLKKRVKQNSIKNKEANKDQTPKDPLIYNDETNCPVGESQAKLLINNPPIPESSSSSSSSSDQTSIGTELILDSNNNNEDVFQPYAEASGISFWTEPFLDDDFYNFYYIYNDLQAPFADPGYAAFETPFLDGETLW